MTLSARIAVGSSRRIARLATLIPAGGIGVAAATLALRWPAYGPVLILAAVTASLLVAASGRRPASGFTMIVSHHPEVEVLPLLAGVDAPWRLAESTMAWPGFAMIALRPVDASIRARVVRVPVCPAEQPDDDRRALGRFLTWSLHGGAGDGASSSRS